MMDNSSELLWFGKSHQSATGLQQTLRNIFKCSLTQVSLYPASFSIFVLVGVVFMDQTAPAFRSLTTVPPLKGRNMFNRGTSAVIDIHSTSPARPLQIEYPAVLKKTMCFWGAKYNPSPSPLGLRNGSEGGKTGGRRARLGVMGLPGFHIREDSGGLSRGSRRLKGPRTMGPALEGLRRSHGFSCWWNSSRGSALINHRPRLRWEEAFWEINCSL